MIFRSCTSVETSETGCISELAIYCGTKIEARFTSLSLWSNKCLFDTLLWRNAETCLRVRAMFKTLRNIKNRKNQSSYVNKLKCGAVLVLMVVWVYYIFQQSWTWNSLIFNSCVSECFSYYIFIANIFMKELFL